MHATRWYAQKSLACTQLACRHVTCLRAHNFQAYIHTYIYISTHLLHTHTHKLAVNSLSVMYTHTHSTQTRWNVWVSEWVNYGWRLVLYTDCRTYIYLPLHLPYINVLVFAPSSCLLVYSFINILLALWEVEIARMLNTRVVQFAFMCVQFR